VRSQAKYFGHIAGRLQSESNLESDMTSYTSENAGAPCSLTSSDAMVSRTGASANGEAVGTGGSANP